MILDISVHNGTFNWSKASEQGVELIIVKASQNNGIDVQFITNMLSSKNFPNIAKGAYHYLDYTLLHYTKGYEIAFGKKQANAFFNAVKPYILDGTLKVTVLADGVESDATLWLDIEDHSSFGGWESLDVNIDRVMKIALAFKTELERLLLTLGLNWKCNIYTNCGISQHGKNFTSGWLWLAWYTSVNTPDYKYVRSDGSIYYVTGAWQGKWLLHQYTSKGNGILYGNSIGNIYIDQNNLNPRYSILKKEVVIPTEPEVPATEPTAPEDTDVSVSTGTVVQAVYLRTGPSVTYSKWMVNSVYYLIPKDSIVTILETTRDSSNNLWLRIGYNQWACAIYNNSELIKVSN